MSAERKINAIIEDLENAITPQTTINKTIKLLEFLRDEPSELMGLTELGISERIQRVIE